MRKFEVSPSVTRSRTYAGHRRFARNPNAIPVASDMLLTWRRVDTHVRGIGPLPKSAGIRTVSGRDMLNILSGWRTGDLGAFR